MIFRTFKAATFAEVLRQVRQALGKDAVIVHTRTLLTRRWLGLRREVTVEMTVAHRHTMQLLRALARTPHVSLN